jgi:Uma2 family endonuclease
MPPKVLMDVEEYLKTSFEDGDCEYLDGEVVERNVGELPHARVQGTLLFRLTEMARRLGIQAVPEIRIQIHARRYRVADIAVWRAGHIGERIPTVAPFLIIEILSSEDRMIRVQHKIQEYLSIGAEWIWLIDPIEKQAICYSRKNPAGALTDVLKTENPEIEIPLAQVLAA